MSHLISLFQKNSHWPLVQKVVLTLNKAGEKAFLAGGCVRDALLGQAPKDFDIATSARPEKIIQLFPKSRPQGKAFGVTAVFDSQGHEVEVATFRKDGPYRDGRHPEYVEFLSDKEDALRRDFTINSLFYNISTDNIIDYVGGLSDIQKRVMRCVGHPETRFQEDHLRILRALRFSLKLNFPIEKHTEQSLFKMKHLLLHISKERVYQESLKILQTGKWSQAMLAFNQLGLLSEWTSLSKFDLSQPFYLDFWSHKAPIHFIKDPVFLWTMAFFPLLIQVPQSQTYPSYLKKWAFPLAVIKGVQNILKSASFILPQRPSRLGKKLRILNSPLAPYMLFLCKTYLKSQKQDLKDIERLEREFKVRATKGKLPKALVNGYDLKVLGFFTGDKKMALRLEQIYDMQLEQNIQDKDLLLKKIRVKFDNKD